MDADAEAYPMSPSPAASRPGDDGAEKFVNAVVTIVLRYAVDY